MEAQCHGIQDTLYPIHECYWAQVSTECKPVVQPCFGEHDQAPVLAVQGILERAQAPPAIHISQPTLSPVPGLSKQGSEKLSPGSGPCIWQAALKPQGQA